jgi:hypothetical protein
MIASKLDIVYESKQGRINHGFGVTPSKIVYIKSHVRTRKWYENGRAIVNHNANKNCR